MLNKHLAGLYDFYVGSEANSESNSVSSYSSYSSYSLTPITERPEWKRVATHFKKKAISPQQRMQAKVNNQQKLAEAIEGRSQVIRTLGGTGTGKTTSFCLHAYDAPTGKFLLIVPTKAMVINAVSSLYGIKQLEAEENEIVSEESVIFPITETRKGWNQKLDEMYDPKKSILVVMTSSMFMSTIDYWLDEDYCIMFDEPDDKSNSANSPTALLALHKIELKNKQYKWPQYRKVSNADDAEDYFEDFKAVYVGNGGSYGETPKHHIGSYLHHIKMMKKRMTNFKGKIFLASATIPEWLNRRVNQMSQKPATIEMEKPKNPRCAMFLPDYDDILKICLEEGNMGALYEPLVGQVLNLASWINRTSEDIKNSIPVNDRQTQMRSRHTIAIGLPGLYEVNQIKMMLEKTFRKHGNLFNHLIVTPQNREEMEDMKKSASLDTIIFELIPSHELRGMNFNASWLFLTPLCRYRTISKNVTELRLEKQDIPSVIQADGRAGRLAQACLIYVGSEEMYNDMETEIPFNIDGIDDVLSLMISRSLSQQEFHTFVKSFCKATGIDISFKEKEMIDNGLLTVKDDRHFELTRKGNIRNVFYDNLEMYLSLEDFLMENQMMTQESFLKISFWMMLLVEHETGKNTLFQKKVGYDGKEIKIPDLHQESRIQIQESMPLKSMFELHKIDSQYMYLWGIVEAIFQQSSDPWSNEFNFSLFQNKDSYGRRGYFNGLLNSANLNSMTIRNCAMNAIGQVKRMESSGLVQFQEAHQTIKIDDIREFWKDLVLKWLSQERVQIAVQVSTDEMDVLYIGSDGCQVIVPQTLMISPESDLIIIIKSIVKPNMLGKNLSIGILTMPITVLGKGAHSILEHLHQEGITVPEVCQIRDWLQDDRQVPFQLKDNTIRFDSNPCGSIKELSELGITILKCLRHLHQCQQELKYDDEAEASTYSSLFEKIMGVSNTGEGSVYGQLESENNLILDNYELISHNHRNAFRCYYVLKHPISGKSYACTCTSDEDDTLTFHQKMSCTPRYESVEQLQQRQSSSDDIESRPVCGICGEVESTLLAVPVILSNPKDTTQQILTAFHQNCLRERYYNKQCPLTGNIISYYGQSSDNVFEIELSPEAEIPVDMKKQALFLQKMIDAESETDDIRKDIWDINHYTGTNYTFETLKEMKPTQLKLIWTTYYKESTMICNSARRQNTELEEKKARFKMEKELKRLQENAKMKASPLKYTVDFKLPQQQPKEQEKESCEKQQQPRQPRQRRRPRQPLASSGRVRSKQASPVSDERPKEVEVKQVEVKQVEVKVVKSRRPQFSPEDVDSREKQRRPRRFVPKRQQMVGQGYK